MASVPANHHQPLHNFSLPFLNWGHKLQLNHCRRRHLNNRTKPHRFPIDGETDAVLPEKGTGSGKIVEFDVATTEDDGDVKPWKLRSRRPVIDAAEKDRGKKRKLWIALTKEEIEEDVYAFTGSRPARRPKKRNRTAQKHVDNVFPGLYLVGISADSYRL